MKNTILSFLILIPGIIYPQIKSGPMLGYKTMREVAVWVQTETQEKLMFTVKHPLTGKVDSTYQYTKPENVNTITFIARNLQPGKTYAYEIISEKGKPVSGTFSTQEYWTNDSVPNFNFAVGSCAYLNDAQLGNVKTQFGSSFEIFQTIARKSPEFMLWLGDNVYLRKSDFGSHSGIYNRYTLFKSQEQLQPLWQKTHHYAIWDDHDYGPNDADRSFYNKHLTTAAFKDFWANQQYGVSNSEGIYSQFSYYDADFFLLDNRTFRSPNNLKNGDRTVLGKEQLQWLKEALVNSSATFKFVVMGGQFLNSAKVWENYSNYEKERKYILKFLKEHEIQNVIFLSGDRHKTELSTLRLTKNITLYDFTSSPLASRSYDSSNEGNKYTVSGTSVSTQNFGHITIHTTQKGRTATLKTFNKEGIELWTVDIIAVEK